VLLFAPRQEVAKKQASMAGATARSEAEDRVRFEPVKTMEQPAARTNMAAQEPAARAEVPQVGGCI
jgi:hypothetical protein